jgi:hypothetical protein
MNRIYEEDILPCLNFNDKKVSLNYTLLKQKKTTLMHETNIYQIKKGIRRSFECY